ncbi:alkaline-phosphatase-like protein, partial [Cokeromyces recurvatus]|uniref:alkaline-phosphatase-like protein n=1 Tax=Cokeromyces recurvatus TaxID=90255 RepID=UPI0022205E85
MQRIKGLMTGSLPTFIDAGSNFDSSAVTEDHLLRHIATRYHNRYFMGDDTWVTLFPESFVANQTWALESFKMLDLDSVDNAIEAQLWPLLNNNETHWELIITHFLGVDHCGHTYGPSNPHMSRKLQQMNTVIERLLEHVDNDTLLVIMGDHGMSSEGDHGGESVEELTSTLFLHSERRLTHIQNKEFYKRIHDKRSQLLGYELSDITKRLNYDASKHPIVAQIHLVPTLAYLLQVPIPFGNLGAIIPDVLYPLEKTDQQDYLWHMAEQFRINALQVHDYLQQYTQNTHHLDFSEDKLESMYAYLYKAEEILFQLLEQQSNDITRQLEEAILAYDHFLISTINYCKTIWAQFDTGSMILGLMLLGLNTLLTLIAALKMTWITTWPKMLTILSGIVAVMGGSSYYFIDTILQLIPVHWFEKMGKEDWIATSIIVSILLSFIILLLRKERDTKMLATTVTVGCIVLRGCTLGSNSFVVWEDQSTEFILATLSVAWTLSNLFSIINQQASMNHSWKSKVIQFLNAIFHPLLFLILVRLLSVIGQCREEQFPYCHYLQSNDLLEF